MNYNLQPFKKSKGNIKLINILIAGEDHRYLYHPGVDIIAICRAIWKNLCYHSHEGASTIEQQLVRVITGRYERTFIRKIYEIKYAVRLSLRYDKKTIAWNYLLSAYYGTQYNNLESILRKFGYNLNDDIPESICAEIVARLKYPEPRDLSTNRLNIINRRKEYILYLYKKYKVQDIYLFNEQI